MKSKLIYLIPFFIFCQVSNSQIITKTGFKDNRNDTFYRLPDTEEMLSYYDSLTTQLKKKLLTGYTFSVYNEIVSNQTVKYSFDGQHFYNVTSDQFGRFYIIPESSEYRQIHFIYSENREYHTIDTIYNIRTGNFDPLILWLQPRYKILLRGRALTGKLPLEGVNVDIIHLSDTFRTKTLDCFTDDEEYWNCLYKGMFKQEIIFDNPADTIKIKLTRSGYTNYTGMITCADYDGRIIPVKMKYSKLLPKLYKHHISLKIGPPVFKNWMVAVNYNYLFQIRNFNRVSAGFDAGMILTDRSTKIPTFPDQQSATDSSYIFTSFDTTYVSTFVDANAMIWITNPLKRKFSLFTGISVPLIFPQNKIYLHPFIGGRYYLDLNKAFIVEARYLNYDLEVKDYYFNSFGNAESGTINISVKKLYFNIGLQICF